MSGSRNLWCTSCSSVWGILLIESGKLRQAGFTGCSADNCEDIPQATDDCKGIPQQATDDCWRCITHNLTNDQVCQVQLWALVCTSCYQSGIYCWYGNTEQQQGLIGEVNRGSSRNCQVEATSKNRTILYLLNFLSFHWWGCRVLISISKTYQVSRE